MFHHAVECWNGVDITQKELEAPFVMKSFP
jgi:hypothetical protein